MRRVDVVTDREEMRARAWRSIVAAEGVVMRSAGE